MTKYFFLSLFIISNIAIADISKGFWCKSIPGERPIAFGSNPISCGKTNTTKEVLCRQKVKCAYVGEEAISQANWFKDYQRKIRKENNSIKLQGSMIDEGHLIDPELMGQLSSIESTLIDIAHINTLDWIDSEVSCHATKIKRKNGKVVSVSCPDANTCKNQNIQNLVMSPIIDVSGGFRENQKTNVSSGTSGVVKE